MQGQSHKRHDRFQDATAAGFRELAAVLAGKPWLAQGTVIEVLPGQKSSTHANTTYMWTRKVRAKTVTVALSREQFEAFSQAIEANRRVEYALRSLRELTQHALLETLPGVPKRRSGNPADSPPRTSNKGLK
jgi:hypothetical protein